MLTMAQSQSPKDMMHPKPKRGKKGTKRKRQGKEDAAYLSLVRRLPCVICGAQPVDAHHPIMGRFSQSRVADDQAIPLCRGHHMGGPGYISVHNDRADWEGLYGLDTDYVEETQKAVETMRDMENFLCSG